VNLSCFVGIYRLKSRFCANIARILDYSTKLLFIVVLKIESKCDFVLESRQKF